jgi:hypothetical protein
VSNKEELPLQVLAKTMNSLYSGLMPGNPIKREMQGKIKAAGGVEGLLARVAQGRTLISLAAELGVSRQIVSGLLNSDAHSAALKKAREQAAGVLAEESKEIADAAQPETERVARLQIDTRRWLAGKWDRPGYGEQAASAVQVDVRVLHLDALRRRQAETPAAVGTTTPLEVTQRSTVMQ